MESPRGGAGRPPAASPAGPEERESGCPHSNSRPRPRTVSRASPSSQFCSFVPRAVLGRQVGTSITATRRYISDSDFSFCVVGRLIPRGTIPVRMATKT